MEQQAGPPLQEVNHSELQRYFTFKFLTSFDTQLVCTKNNNKWLELSIWMTNTNTGGMNGWFMLPWAYPWGEDRSLPPPLPLALLLTPVVWNTLLLFQALSKDPSNEDEGGAPSQPGVLNGLMHVHSCRWSTIWHEWFVVPCRQLLLIMRAVYCWDCSSLSSLWVAGDGGDKECNGSHLNSHNNLLLSMIL